MSDTPISARRWIARGVDDAFAGLALGRFNRRRPRSRAERLDPRQRVEALQRVASTYGAWAADEARFFPEPAPIQPEKRLLRRIGAGGEVLDLRWDSEFEPLDEGRLRERYLGHDVNHRCAARWYRHPDRPRACAVLVHGYMSGRPAMDRWLMPVQRLYAAGLDVALFVLPYHGVRARPGRQRWTPVFPNADVRFTIEALRQSCYDLRALHGYLRSDGCDAIGNVGMSLGAYVSALHGTVDPHVAFLGLLVPLASFGDAAVDSRRLVGTPEEQEAQRRALETAYAPVSPLERAPRIDSERVLVMGGEVDRVTPIRHAERLSEHFDAKLMRFPGGHLLQFGRGDGFGGVEALLRELGHLPPR